MMALTILSSILTPLQLGWPEAFTPFAAWLSLYLVVEGCFLLDILVRFRTGHRDTLEIGHFGGPYLVSCTT